MRDGQIIRLVKGLESRLRAVEQHAAYNGVGLLALQRIQARRLSVAGRLARLLARIVGVKLGVSPEEFNEELRAIIGERRQQPEVSQVQERDSKAV